MRYNVSIPNLLHTNMTQATPESLFQQGHELLLNNPDNCAAAVPLLHKAAQAGHIEAAFQLAGCLLNGAGARPDYRAARHWLTVAAESGHPYARYNLLQLRAADGERFEQQIGEYTALAESGVLHAQMRLLEYYADQKDPQAVYWAELAAAQGSGDAQFYLAKYYQQAPEPDLAKAHELLMQAAAQGVTAAHWLLGNQYRYGQYVEKNLQKAIEHFTPAAGQGFAPAQAALGEVLFDQDNGESIGWLEKAAAQGDTDAQAVLAEAYLTGRLVARDHQKARKHASAAARRNHPKALRLLGDIFRYGLGVGADADIARRQYRRAAELGDMAAHQKLLADTALTHQEDYEETKQAALMFQKADLDYQAAFACHYGLGRGQDYFLARKLYLQAAELHHRKAQTNLGMMYYNGQGVNADAGQAAYWFEQAANQGDPVAQYNLACLYYHGTGAPQSTAAACAWLQQAIDSGHEHADQLRRLLQQWQRERR
ncbi:MULTISPECIES: tetratricopeptide repeat protein [unclassified Neisseria]|uniref:tetratricopeptide repeat protein n=1 Tax=unclassified Neisseria TaxID=2623750 RepID=UPI001D16CB7A|nr:MULTISPECIES: tetratricopeptide repeat protein [unclassified Neisseria]